MPFVYLEKTKKLWSLHDKILCLRYIRLFKLLSQIERLDERWRFYLKESEFFRF